MIANDTPEWGKDKILPVPAIDLQARGITLEQAADLRARLAAFAEEWESPEMEIYDGYDATSPRLPTPRSTAP